MEKSAIYSSLAEKKLRRAKIAHSLRHPAKKNKENESTRRKDGKEENMTKDHLR